MYMVDDETFPRRHLLKTTAAATTYGLLAGCTGGDGGGSGDGGSGDGGDGGSGGDGGGGDGGGTDFPQEDIRLVIPYGAGGYDVYTRMVAPYVKEYLPNDVEVVPENRPGAGGATASTEVYNAEPDGYTLMIFNLQSFVRNQLLGLGNYQTAEMTPIAHIAQNIRSIGVRQDLDIHTFDEFADAVSNRELTFAGTGPADGSAVVSAVIGSLTGLWEVEDVYANFVSNDGKGEHATSMERGDVDVMAGSYSSVLPYEHPDGPVRTIFVCTTDDEPPEPTPDAQTFADTDVDPGLAEEIADTVTSFRLFLGPPGIPDERTTILQEAFAEAIQDPDFVAEAEEVERPVVYLPPSDIGPIVQNVFNQWSSDELQPILEKIQNA